jgi:hypothetical protein
MKEDDEKWNKIFKWILISGLAAFNAIFIAFIFYLKH